ncbi:hypothetical protein JCM10212_006593, partial [Sporobolomyces blumeae]
VGCDEILYRHFAALTEQMLSPVSRYLVTASNSSPLSSPVSLPGFLASLHAHGSGPFQFRSSSTLSSSFVGAFSSSSSVATASISDRNPAGFVSSSSSSPGSIGSTEKPGSLGGINLVGGGGGAGKRTELVVGSNAIERFYVRTWTQSRGFAAWVEARVEELRRGNEASRRS